MQYWHQVDDHSLQALESVPPLHRVEQVVDPWVSRSTDCTPLVMDWRDPRCRLLAVRHLERVALEEHFELDRVQDCAGHRDGYVLSELPRCAFEVHSPSRTTLLPLQPAPQTMKVKDMPTTQLLRRVIRSGYLDVSIPFRLPRYANHHLLPTDDARLIAQPLHLFSRSIGVESVHIPRGSTISDQVAASGEEGSKGHVDVSEDVKGDAVVKEDDCEEREVGEEFYEVCERAPSTS